MPFPKLVANTPELRDAILDAARELFAERGYDGTSIHDIITAVGISKGGFYHHFAAKEDLIEALACRYAAESARQAEELLADPTLDSFSRLSAFFTAIRRHKIDSAAQLRSTFAPLLRAENAQLNERTQRAVLKFVRPTLVRIIREGVEERTFDTPNPEGAADIIMHLMTANRGLAVEMFATRDKAAFDRMAEQFVAQLRYLATVIDRILGLPEGSLDFVDQDSVTILLCMFDGTSDAA